MFLDSIVIDWIKCQRNSAFVVSIVFTNCRKYHSLEIIILEKYWNIFQDFSYYIIRIILSNFRRYINVAQNQIIFFF